MLAPRGRNEKAILAVERISSEIESGYLLLFVKEEEKTRACK